MTPAEPPPDDGRSPAPRPRPSTIEDVAREAGVSRAAVSKVIRNAYGVSARMRAQVEAAIERLEYRPRVAARAMRGASFTLGFEIPQVGNDFLTMIVDGATEALAASPYQLIIAPLGRDQKSDMAINSLADRQVDGIVAISPRVDPAWMERIAERTPLVMIGRHDTSDRYDTITGDDRSGAEQVMTHLIELGHRRIVHLTIYPLRPEPPWAGQAGDEPHVIRNAVYHERMLGLGLRPRVVHTVFDGSEAHAATRSVLDSPEPPTAIFAGNDTLAIGVLSAIADAGLDERDVSVVGYDDIPIARHPLVSLSSVDQSGVTMGREAARLLLEQLAGRTTTVQLEIATQLRERRSSAPPRRP
ncbi:LacI family DNA-binding transcriptional regulator [Promicromonospora sp. NPDC057138]|uniref:LacI family DNA-binding transcriptional regulator n=1 Tax=Promicromonospora sp. NPDC057138 TaxID=3346031 RepID=UPI00363E7EDC